MRRVLVAVAIVLAAVFLPACSTTMGVKGRGHLLIVGGGARDDNEQLFGRFFDLAALPAKKEGRLPRIGVIPTASGVEKPGASTVETMKAFRPGTAEIALVPIYKDTPQLASDPAIVEQIRSCDALWFCGGAQSRIIDVFRPGGVDTPAAMAARSVLARGGVIAGTSAGAAMMSDPMIRNGTSANAIKYGVIRGEKTDEDDAKGVGVGTGMGFFPYGLTDQHFLQRGRLGRLIVAMEACGQPLGFGVAENSAMDVDLATGTIEALGPAAMLVVDRRGSAKAEGMGGWLGVRVSLMSTGDVVDARSGKVRPGSAAVARPAGASTAAPAGAPWGKNVVTDLVRRLADSPGTPAVAMDDDVELRLRADGRTRFYADPKDAASITAVDVIVDVVKRR